MRGKARPHAQIGNDNEVFGKKNGITDENVALHEPSHTEITGDRAYVVVPATLTYKQHGKPGTEAGRSGHLHYKRVLRVGA
jgi:hypothetical protein